ncbi:preprotein translocase subunit SecE [Candidatus Walczuchella monophlebidarum]|uniref:Putative preprotein translocase subunit SecE n=1 Tax=Candidatus Walczuchella monophlebidarum TaxID=1415657 RepID=A0A068DSS3_9FLAO|nr:putative preprotein translocase subunit SecE [Candidatus Walczuchella monophlebidarum]
MRKIPNLDHFFNEFVRNVTWPKWEELQSSAVMVSVSVFILSLIVSCIDAIFGIVFHVIF